MAGTQGDSYECDIKVVRAKFTELCELTKQNCAAIERLEAKQLEIGEAVKAFNHAKSTVVTLGAIGKAITFCSATIAACGVLYVFFNNGGF